MNFWVEVLPPVAGALLCWWGSTGVIIYLCGRKAWRPWVFGVVTALQPLAFWQLWATKQGSDVGAVFMSFFWAAVIWSWIETSYYSGFVVGRKTEELEPDAPDGLRFRRAIAANLYHELGILVLSVVVVVVGAGGANEIGLWIFMILHWTHQSAKINIFLGVNNLTTEFLPDNLKYMAQYFKRKSLNTFFPFSVTITTVLATFLFSTVLEAKTAGQQVGQVLLFVLMCAAILEHWWLVTPVPTRIWNWALKSRTAEDTTIPAIAPDIYIICGYLGSGKTTLLQNLLPQLNGRVAVIVNDFGAVGVDAELIRAQGAAGAVLELPGGCMCCTLQKNLTGQIIKLLEDYRPERILIEPSGVAGIEEIIRSLAHPRLVGRLGPVEVVAVVDGPRLLASNGLQEFTVTQVKTASAVVVSKTDLILPGELSGLLSLVGSLNPQARLFPAIQGQVSAGQLFNLSPDHDHEGEAKEGEETHGHLHDEENGLISFAREYSGVFDPAALEELFEELGQGYFGPIERAKGLFPISAKTLQSWDLAAGRVFSRTLPGNSTARFMLVASDVAGEELERRLKECLRPSVTERH